MDKDGYPDEAELKLIQEWDILKFSSSIKTLMDFIEDRWQWPDRGFIRNKNKIELHTGGWSGNESLIGALQDNTMFWTMCWMKSERGGHYWFEIPLSLQSINPATEEQP